MADGATRSPSRLCSRDGKICCYGDALSTIFLLLCLASYFAFSFLSFLTISCTPVCLSSSCPFVCTAAIYYSQQVRILWYVFFLLVVSFVPYLISELFCVLLFLVFFRSSYFSGGVFFCCALVPGTLALDLPTLFSDVWFSSDCDHRIYTSLG